MSAISLAQELWKLSEEAKSVRDKMLLEIAGNLAEDVYFEGSWEELVDQAIKDAKEHLLKDK